jgi:hypothetical protein
MFCEEIVTSSGKEKYKEKNAEKNVKHKNNNVTCKKKKC